MEAPMLTDRQEKMLLTVDEAAQVLHLSRRFVYTLIMSKQLFTVKIGRSRRVPWLALQAFVQRQMEQTW